MTFRLSFGILTVAALAWAQSPAGYVDDFTAQVKPEKLTDFSAIAKKIAEANHKYKGDTWVAFDTIYGAQNTITFVSPRENLASIEDASTTFEKAMKEAYGPAYPKIFQDMNSCLLSSRADIRRRRPDLSWRIPLDNAGVMKLVGESKWLRIRNARVRAGHEADFEEHVVKAVKAAFEKSSSATPTFVSSVIFGRPAGTYVFSSFAKTLGDFDIPANVRELMGEEAYGRFQKALAEDELTTEVTIARIRPAFSNPAAEIAAAAPDFWRPKPAAAVHKPKPAPVAPKTGQ